MAFTHYPAIRVTLALLALFFPLVLSTAHAGAPAPRYTVTDLGPLPNVADDVALGVNSHCQVSLWTQSSGGSVHAAIWNGGKLADLGVPAGYPNSIARAIDNRGDVVGWVVSSQNPVDSRSTTRAFVLEGSQMNLLPTLGGKCGRALGMNAKGDIVGMAQTAGGYRHAFVFDGHTMADLGTLNGGVMSEACAINSAGHIAGAADTGRGAQHAVLWIERRIVDLGALPGGKDSFAAAINGNDQVVGSGQTPDGYHAFLWSRGTLRDLGTLKEDPSAAWGINDAGQVVGSSSIGHYTMHAFLWQDGAMTDLNGQIDTSLGWVLSKACTINDSSDIVCLGHKADHRLHALLLTPASSTPGPAGVSAR